MQLRWIFNFVPVPIISSYLLTRGRWGRSYGFFIALRKDFMHDEGLENDYLVKREDGSLWYGYVRPGKPYFPDFTRDGVRKWWGDKVKCRYRNNMVDVPLFSVFPRHSGLELLL